MEKQLQMASGPQGSQVEPFTDWGHRNQTDRITMHSFVSAVERLFLSQISNNANDELSSVLESGDENHSLLDMARGPFIDCKDLDPNDRKVLSLHGALVSKKVEPLQDMALKAPIISHQLSILELCEVRTREEEEDDAFNRLLDMATGWLPRVPATAPHIDIASTADWTTLPPRGTQEYFQHFARPHQYPQAMQIFDLKCCDGKMQFRDPFGQPSFDSLIDWILGSDVDRTRQSPGREKSDSTYQISPHALGRELGTMQDFPRLLEPWRESMTLDERLERVFRIAMGEEKGNDRAWTELDEIPGETELENPAVENGRPR